MTAAFNLIDGMETALRPELDPRVFVQPKDRGTASENARQWDWVRHMHAHARRVLVFAVPNGTNIASMAGRAKVKREGLYTGFPDTGATWTGCTAYLEWKNGKGDPSPEQIECLNRLVAMDHPVGIFRTMEAAVDWLFLLGAPVGVIR